MKTFTWLLPLFSGLALSAAILEEKSADSALFVQPADTLAPGIQDGGLDFSPAPQSTLQAASAAAACSPGYPKYCAAGAYCCQAKYNGCCPRARACVKKATTQCCGTTVCGKKQKCCGNTCCPYTYGQCCSGGTTCCRPGTYCCIANGARRCCYSNKAAAASTGEQAISEASTVFDLTS